MVKGRGDAGPEQKWKNCLWEKQGHIFSCAWLNMMRIDADRR